ncbi:hypothetical protein BZG42_05885 [Streptococcus sp. DAT741]|nr:hypothetical protein BZG42_05885 [Streptococcus sp. DAT741]
MRKEPPYKNSIQLFYTVHYKWFFSKKYIDVNGVFIEKINCVVEISIRLVLLFIKAMKEKI